MRGLTFRIMRKMYTALHRDILDRVAKVTDQELPIGGASPVL